MAFKRKHKHKWKAAGFATLKDENGKEHLRLVIICDKCLMAFHEPIYTLKKMKEVEKE